MGPGKRKALHINQKQLTMTDKKATTAQYISRYLRLRIVIKPSYNKEVDGRVIVMQGQSIQFEDGVFKTDDEALIQAIEARPEFGDIITKVPSNVEAMLHREKTLKSLEEREAEVKAREEAVAKAEAKVQASGEGAGVGSPSEAQEDDLTGMKKAELLEVAEKEAVEGWETFKKPGVKNAVIADAIREARKAKGEQPAF